MTDAPIAYTVHPGGRAIAPEQQQALARWLPANGINPNLVSIAAPITVLPVPHGQGPDGDPWLIQVIVFQQFHVDHTGVNEHNLITGEPVAFQRTVPLQVPYPFPTEPATDGEAHGQADGQAAQEAPEELVRDQGQAGVPDRHEGQGEERAREGEDPWNEGAAEGRPSRSDEALPEPEEDRRKEIQQEEVGGAR